MNVYLAGTYSRNYVTQDMNLYLATPHAYPNIVTDKTMEIYLAGGCTGNNNPIWRANVATPEAVEEVFPVDQARKIFILESFYYIQDWMNVYISRYWNFMLDSGAFTFMENAGKAGSIDWESYVDRYAEFINANNVEHFLELDIDAIESIKTVERLRDRLESATGRRSIPVWHISRGKDYWNRMCRDYDYVAIGGIVSGEITKKMYPGFKVLLAMAKDQGTKVHGLGFTNLKGLAKYPFHSVDSTAWIYGNRSGFLYRFNGKTMEKFHIPEGSRLKAKDAAIWNFNEWIKFQRWAVDNL